MAVRHRHTTPAAVNLGDYVERAVRSAPPLSRGQRQRLGALLRPAVDDVSAAPRT